MEPLKLLFKSYREKSIALLILNCPAPVIEKKLGNLWPKAVIKVATDGAANQLKHINEKGHNFIPDVISGDFDSAESTVLEHFKGLGTEILHTPDQDDTDFTKALKYIIAKPNIEYDVIVVIGGMFESRVDHVFANFDTLYKATELTDKEVFLFIDDSVNVVLKPGTHVIHVDTGLEGEWCGIIPLGQRCKSITTTGLKWNLNQDSLQFQHGMISTSNTWDGSKVVTIDTSDAVLWTMGIKGNN